MIGVVEDVRENVVNETPQAIVDWPATNALAAALNVRRPVTFSLCEAIARDGRLACRSASCRLVGEFKALGGLATNHAGSLRPVSRPHIIQAGHRRRHGVLLGLIGGDAPHGVIAVSRRGPLINPVRSLKQAAGCGHSVKRARLAMREIKPLLRGRLPRRERFIKVDK